MLRANHLYRVVQYMYVFCYCCVFLVIGLCDLLANCTVGSYTCLSVLSVVCSEVEVCATS